VNLKQVGNIFWGERYAVYTQLGSETYEQKTSAIANYALCINIFIPEEKYSYMAAFGKSYI
jgi:hypothetical protein